MIRLERTLAQLAKDLREFELPWALVGGLAVSIRAEPRTTRDLDVAIAAGSDREAEQIVSRFTARGYAIATILEQEAVDRLATVRLLTPCDEPGEIVADLLFFSSGVEAEIVAGAEILEALPGLRIPVARLADLLALKVLAGRPKDLADIESLLEYAVADDLIRARETLGLIHTRGCSRKKDLMAQFEELVESR